MTAPDLSLATAEPRARPRALSRFLFAIAGLVFAMVVIGGITRLTESGLSITQWNLVSGAIRLSRTHSGATSSSSTVKRRNISKSPGPPE